MAVGLKLRFEVFKRDGFKCQYCGRMTPQVVLEVDHVIPVAKGGSDDMTNLVTSCFECNRGKRDGLLDDRAPTPDMHDQAILLLEREMQLKEYNEAKKRVLAREHREVNAILDYWDELAGGKARKTPEIMSLKMFLRAIPFQDIKDAMESAYLKNGDWRGVSYLYGILHKWRKERTGEGADE